jgi:hypothetical protein
MTAMLGVAGHLLSTTFLANEIERDEPPRGPDREIASWRARCAASLGPAVAPQSVMQGAAVPLVELLGFDRPSDVELVDGVAAASIRHAGAVAAVIVTPWGEPFDARWRLAISQAGRRGAPWCLLFDGRRLRIVDATRLYARRSVEFDLDLVADDRRTFAAFWRVCEASRVTAGADDGGSLRALVAASDRHAAGVCRSLRDGVLTASTDVLRALIGRRTTRAPATPSEAMSRFSRTPDDARSSGTLEGALEQALTIVYRLLFLLFAEARALVPLWHPIYRESYSVESLRDAAERLPHPVGLWDALRAIARLAHAGCRAGDLRVTAFNGRLFAPARTPLAERRDLDDDAARRAVVALSTRPAADRAGRERIDYRDLGVEQLGAVYETLLDYEPRAQGRSVTLQSGSGVRKETGTFYTPQPIADYLVRRTLEPLVRDLPPDRILQLRIVDPAMGSGAFLVAACRFLASAYEAALVRAGACHPSDVDEPERAAFRRAIAERCLYGVDLNPMAVQLARLSLWLATLAADRPLSFLDHRLQVGDSLLGTWLSHLRRPPGRRRHDRHSPLPLFGDEAVSVALREALPIRFSLEATPNDTVDQVRDKERALARLTARHAALSRWKRVAHLWCAAWLSPPDRTAPASAFAPLSDTALAGRGALSDGIAQRYLDAADETGAARRLFHWELEFPEVFFDRDGRRLARAGFDAAIGNPPWDMIRADAGEAGMRARARASMAPALRFTRDSGVYTAQSAGHANRYQLFAERAVALTREGGRIGLVLPSGLATDHGSSALRRLLFSRCDVDAIVGMDNQRGVFPIHRGVRFLLITASTGSPTREISCRLGLDDPAALESIDGDNAPAPAPAAASAPVRLTPALLDRISGPSLTIPQLRDATDLAIVERAASLFPPLADASGWRATFGRELNATDDRPAIRTGRAGLPVIDGRHLEPFRIALDASTRSISAADARRLLRSNRHDRARLAYRDVASATNRVTFIAAVLPGGCVSTHTVFCLRTPLTSRAQHFLCGLFNSLVVNYLVRLRVTTHVTTATVERLPIPVQEHAPAAFAEIAALARLLSRRRDRTAFARLNARAAELYQLSAEEFDHVLRTFPLIPIDERTHALSLFRTA